MSPSNLSELLARKLAGREDLSHARLGEVNDSSVPQDSSSPTRSCSPANLVFRVTTPETITMSQILQQTADPIIARRRLLQVGEGQFNTDELHYYLLHGRFPERPAQDAHILIHCSVVQAGHGERNPGLGVHQAADTLPTLVSVRKATDKIWPDALRWCGFVNPSIGFTNHQIRFWGRVTHGEAKDDIVPILSNNDYRAWYDMNVKYGRATHLTMKMTYYIPEEASTETENEQYENQDGRKRKVKAGEAEQVKRKRHFIQ